MADSKAPTAEFGSWVAPGALAFLLVSAVSVVSFVLTTEQQGRVWLVATIFSMALLAAVGLVLAVRATSRARGFGLLAGVLAALAAHIVWLFYVAVTVGT